VNAYPAEGDLPRTTDELYGECLHKYTVKEAIRDEAVLGFQTEHLGAQKLNADDSNEDLSVYETEAHMLKVLDTIINKSQEKLGFKHGRGKTYEAILTVNSIKRAQAYYDLLKRVVNGETSVTISEETRRVLPDFPKFAITYSVSSDEDNESADLNVPKMKESLEDYNAMFGTSFGIGEIKGYNTNLNDRLARKKSKFKSIVDIAKKKVRSDLHNSFEKYAKTYSVSLDKDDVEQADDIVKSFQEIFKDSIGDIRPFTPKQIQQQDDDIISGVKKVEL
jgi:type I restriction enzyme R subunit